MALKFVGKFLKLGQQLKSEIMAEKDIKATGMRPMMIESFVYSKSYGVSGVCLGIGGMFWTWNTNRKQFDWIVSNLENAEKWQQKIKNMARKTILDCESIKIAMLFQAYKDTEKEKIDKSSIKSRSAYELFLDSLRQESQNELSKDELQNHISKVPSHKKGELLVLMVDVANEEEEKKKRRCNLQVKNWAVM